MAQVLDAPIPTTVDVSIDETSNCSSNEQEQHISRNYGTNTATQFSSPLGLFDGDCAAAKTSSASASASASSPTPNLVAVDHDSGSDGDNLWQVKLAAAAASAQQQQEQETAITSSKSSIPPSIQPLPVNDNVDRLVHPQTSEGHYLVNSRPLDSPMAGLKYSLQKGKKAMTLNQRRASVDIKKTRPNHVVQSVSDSASNSTTKSAAVPSFKIFLLLIQPKSKIFEIIQVFYAPSQTTIQNVLEMIPANATEPALGSQHYVGICRPNDGNAISTANIVQGEILVAIPEHYSGSLCSKISKPILANPKVTKLLTRSDPLAPRKKSKRKKKHRVIAIETVTEETESMASSPSPAKPTVSRILSPANEKPLRKNMKENRSVQEKDALRMALQHAAREAASTNAQVRETNHASDANSMNDSAGSLYSDCDIPVEMWKTTMSLKSRASTYQRSDSIGDSSTIASFGESNSLCGNQSVNSLDTTEYQYKRMPRRSRARPSTLSARRAKRKKQVRILIAVVLVMVIRYIMVGRAATAVETAILPQDADERSSSMFGILSLLQVTFAFVAFVKTQRYLEGRGDVQDCPFCQFVLTAWRKANA